MAFRIAKKPTFSAQVEVLTPNQKCGHDSSKFTGVFHKFDTEQIKLLKKKEQFEVAEEVLAGWGNDLQDEDGNPIEFTEENKAFLLSIPEAAIAVALTFWNNSFKGKQGN